MRRHDLSFLALAPATITSVHGPAGGRASAEDLSRPIRMIVASGARGRGGLLIQACGEEARRSAG
jgi:hypothetical protein